MAWGFSKRFITSTSTSVPRGTSPSQGTTLVDDLGQTPLLQHRGHDGQRSDGLGIEPRGGVHLSAPWQMRKSDCSCQECENGPILSVPTSKRGAEREGSLATSATKTSFFADRLMGCSPQAIAHREPLLAVSAAAPRQPGQSSLRPATCNVAYNCAIRCRQIRHSQTFHTINRFQLREPPASNSSPCSCQFRPRSRPPFTSSRGVRGT